MFCIRIARQKDMQWKLKARRWEHPPHPRLLACVVRLYVKRRGLYRGVFLSLSLDLIDIHTYITLQCTVYLWCAFHVPSETQRRGIDRLPSCARLAWSPPLLQHTTVGVLVARVPTPYVARSTEGAALADRISGDLPEMLSCADSWVPDWTGCHQSTAVQNTSPVHQSSPCILVPRTDGLAFVRKSAHVSWIQYTYESDVRVCMCALGTIIMEKGTIVQFTSCRHTNYKTTVA